MKLILGDFYLSKTLGDASDWAPGSTKATFPRRYGKLTVAWNKKTVTFTASSAIMDSSRGGSDKFDPTVADWIRFPYYFGRDPFKQEAVRLAVGFADRTGARDLIFSGGATGASTAPFTAQGLRKPVNLAGALDYTPTAVSFIPLNTFPPRLEKVVFQSSLIVYLKAHATQVLVRVNGGAYQSPTYHAAFEGEWHFFPVTLVPGANVIEAKAIDLSGNESVVKRTVIYSPIEGGYFGLVRAGDSAGEPAGYFSLKATRKNTFTGKLTLGGSKYGFKGTFAADGSATVEVARRKLPPIGLQLQITVDASGTNTLAGSFTLDSEAYALDAERKLPTTRSLAAYWTAVLPPDPTALGDGSLPRGSGFATFSSFYTNNTRVVGKVADGTSFSFAGPRDAQGRLAVYAPVRYGRATGFLAGVAESLGIGPLSGDFSWHKPAQPGAARFPGAFTLHSTLYGTFTNATFNYGYLIPTNGGTARVSAGPTVLLEKSVQVRYASNRFGAVATVIGALPGAEKLALKIVNGVIAGSVILPGQTKPAKIFGVVIFNLFGNGNLDADAYGFCLEPTASHDFTITPNP